MDKLGNQIMLTRKSIGMTQMELAVKAGITAPTLSAIENGGGNSKMNTLQDIAHALGCSLTVRIVDHDNDAL